MRLVLPLMYAGCVGFRREKSLESVFTGVEKQVTF